jgi:2',3'-cyclic-nucleotide 2'-phosphodiesterase (5'-nucleotidase family)
MVGKTLIVSSGSYSEYLGVLKINYVKNINLKVVSYDLKNITSGIPEDKFIAAEIESYKKIVNRDFLSPYHLTYDQVIAYSDYNMESLASAYAEPREMGLGNLITDAYIYAVKNNEGKNYEHISLSLDALGLIRDSFQKGKITTADVFQVLSLGLGRDSIAGYPLVSFYLSGKELKDALEVQTTVAPLEKADAYLQVSGVKFSYNPHRIPFDRVTEVQVRDDQGIFKPLDHKKLYRICMNYYAAEMMNYVTKVTHGILKVQPKDKNGQAINDLSQTIIYMNKGTAKAEELKEWIALTQYLGSFGEGKGITRIPDKYRGPEGRYRAEPSWNPVKLIAGGNGITYGALFVGLFLLCVIGLVIRCAIKKVSPSRKPQ